MTHDRHARQFAEEQHEEGRWGTRSSATHNPILRFFWNTISFKRQGVHILAKRSSPAWRGLDLGCGNGAYSVWFVGQCPCTLIAADWSLQALVQMPTIKGKRILRVCADARLLPFREEVFDFFFTIDTLGHITNVEKALDEALRVTKPHSPFFIHSECNDHLRRWPDRALTKALGRDHLAQLDGHWELHSSAEVYKALLSRFRVEAFFSPAGLLGWLLGYPEKYMRAFRECSRYLLVLVTGFFAAVKRTPVLGAVLRLANALTNRAELFLGIVGGGSCFAFGETLSSRSKPGETSVRDSANRIEAPGRAPSQA